MQATILKLLADGQFHSGQEIADRLQISRSAVWKQIQKFEELGLEISSVSGRGYRLHEPLDLLDRDLLKKELRNQSLIDVGLAATYENRFARIEDHQIVTSTSDYLRQLIPQDPSSEKLLTLEKPALACFSEFQTQGRGRRGRTWIASYAGALCFSVLWKYDTNPMALNGLSLAVGTEIVTVFNALGLGDIGLKWPNDLYWNSRKLGGILFEIIGEESGPCYAIVGIGINIKLAAKPAQLIDQDWVDLRQIWNRSRCQNQPLLSRSELAGQLLAAVSRSMHDFGPQRFEHYRERWRQVDCCFGCPVSVILPQTQIEGIAQGIDEHGQLILKTDDGLKKFASGEVSLRVKS